MTTGAIKSWLPEKGYGFISGDDGKDYFLHKSSLATHAAVKDVRDGALVEFEPKATPKGYRAAKVAIVPTQHCTRYDAPSDFIVTREKQVRGWETITSSNWMVVASSRNPEAARNTMIAAAMLAGANAVINLKRDSHTESTSSNNGRGTYRYTVHDFAGQMAVVGRRNMRGERDLSTLIDMDIAAKESYDNTVAQHKRTTAIVVTLVAIGFVTLGLTSELKPALFAWVPALLYALLIGWDRYLYLPLRR